MNTGHGSPFDRGSADRYYGRNFDPHWYPNGTGVGLRIGKDEMSDEELYMYKLGWDQEIDRKDWGGPLDFDDDYEDEDD